MSKLTFVTGLWDLGRGDLTEGWSRSYSHYLNKFKELLQIPDNLIIFGDSDLEKFVIEHRSSDKPTQFIYRNLDWFKNNEHFDKIQKIRTNSDWYNRAGWLSESTQAKLEMYNPLVMSKIYLLNDAKIIDKFDSDFMFWIDAGLSNTVHMGYFTHDKIQEKLPLLINRFTFIAFPYEANNEIHGFEFNKLCEYAESHVDKVGRGGFFGGPKSTISEINNIYYALMQQTLSEGYMGTEESLFSIMMYKNKEVIDYFEIESNGLICKCFEDIKNNTAKIKNEQLIINTLNKNSISLYVIGFNSPRQFQTLIDSMEQYDKNFLIKPNKYLLNNSTDRSLDELYNNICNKYNFSIIDNKENLGICGGRQYIAEHFEQSDSDYMFFFEDDMFFYNGKERVCRNGFNRYVDNLYHNVIDIVYNENLDFIKLNYTEFFGDNGTQWSWYNVPQDIREKYWPHHKRLPKTGLDPNAPRTEFRQIKSYKGIPYALGDIYYCNWPQVVSKIGNRKMFLETTWAHPYEQTWMSHMYQLTKDNKIKPGLLLTTPTEHNRFEHYAGNLRKES